MCIIKNISIQNFRIIRSFEYSPKQINIITGKNNTGKSALLDAIAFNASGYINLEFRNWVIDNPVDLISSGEKVSSIVSNFNNVSIYSDTDTMSNFHPEYAPEVYKKIINDIKITIKSGLSRAAFNDDTFIADFFNLFFKYYDILIAVSKFGIIIFPYWKKKENSKVFNSELGKLISIFGKSHLEKLSDNDRKEYKLSDFIRPTIPEIFKQKNSETEDEIIPVYQITHFDKTSFEDTTDEGLIILEDFIKQNDLVKNLKRLSNKNVVYQMDDKLVTIPINSHGDGFITLLNSIRYFMKSREGVLIIEEPENHLHPKYIDVFVENLFVYSKKLNVQVFMATHSYDLIQSALKYAQINNMKDSLLISKMTSDGRSIEKFDYDVDQGLKIIDELFLDLRGN
jgi:AAA15 family ATPase/GTPase